MFEIMAELQEATNNLPRSSLGPSGFMSPGNFVSPIPPTREHHEVDTSAQMIRETLKTPNEAKKTVKTTHHYQEPKKHNFSNISNLSEVRTTKRKSPFKKRKYEQAASPKKKIKCRSPTKRLMQMKNSSAKSQMKTQGQVDATSILYNVKPGQAYLVKKDTFEALQKKRKQEIVDMEKEMKEDQFHGPVSDRLAKAMALVEANLKNQ